MVTLVAATLSVAVVASVSVKPFLSVPVTVGAVTVGAVVSSGAVTVTVTNRLLTAGAPFPGVAESWNVSAALGSPSFSVGAVNVAVGVAADARMTDAPDTCDHW